MKEAFETTHQMVSSMGETSLYCGSTAVCAFLWNEENSLQRKLLIGNIGDCRAYIW
jgi:serine/threonine protein phosphatase PrpC